MVVRIHNVGKWQLLPVGEVLRLQGLQRRKVRVEVNCEAPTRFDVIEGDKGTFLAVVTGYDILEFSISAQAHVVATSEGEVWYFTNDGDQIGSDMPEAVSFATVMNRETRNPELELMMWKAEQNMKRRLDMQMAEIEALLAARAAAEVPHNPETGEVIDDGEVSAGNDPGAASPAAGGEGGAAEPAATGQVASAKPGARVPAGSATA